MRERVIIKIGSSSLTTSAGGLDENQIQYFASELSSLKHAGYEVLLVTSGSVAAGFSYIGYSERPVHIHEKQAAAAVGQTLLMQAYHEAFAAHDTKIAQILLTRANFTDRDQVRNAKRTIEELLSHRIIPIINENDTVSVEELNFGDNDTLSALVANLVKATHLVIFTDTDGLYTEDPRINEAAKRISKVEQIDDALLQIAGGAGSAVGTGGMRSKIEAARIAVRGGVPVFVGKATQTGDLLAAVQGDGKGTYFETQLGGLPMKKQWLGFYSHPTGQVIVDHGAEQALLYGGKSLLPAGVQAINGSFHPGEVIEVLNETHQLIGRGVVNYASWQLQAVAGLSTAEAQKRIDVQRLEVIHRDEWVTLKQA